GVLDRLGGPTQAAVLGRASRTLAQCGVVAVADRSSGMRRTAAICRSPQAGDRLAGRPRVARGFLEADQAEAAGHAARSLVLPAVAVEGRLSATQYIVSPRRRDARASFPGPARAQRRGPVRPARR